MSVRGLGNVLNPLNPNPNAYEKLPNGDGGEDP